MAEQIVQTLGFDASEAISTITQLNASLAALSTQLNNVAQGARAFNQAKISRTFNNIKKANPAQTMTQAATAAQNLGNNLANTANRASGALNRVKNDTESLTISWQTLSRIIVAQTIVRGINAISQSVREAITETRELQKRVGEIQTISGGQLGTDADIAAGLQVTAETFGFDILDAAEAKYQELSNQVANSTETLEFQEAAAKLARATNTSLTDSVNLLSSSLNAFGLDATSAEEAAGVLFRTIEQGRVRASELSIALGRVAPAANALGISLDELLAATARLTQGGLRADSALTQVLGIINQLQKPSDALKDIFGDLVVATGEEGIAQSGGFLQFLERINNEAGDTSQLAQAFNNIRAIQGVLGLTATNAEQTAATFESVTVFGTEAGLALEKAFNQSTANDAVEYEKAIAQLSSQFRDLATEVIPLINDALNFFNDTIQTIRDNPVITGSILAAAGGAFIGVGVAATAGAGGLTAFATAAAASLVAIGPAVLIFGAVTAAVVGLNAAFNASEAAAYAPLIERAQNAVDELNKQLEENKLNLAGQAASFKESAAEAARFGAQFTALRRDAQNAVGALNREFTAVANTALRNLLNSRQRITKELQSAVDDAENQIERSNDRTTDIQANKDDFLLQRRLNGLNELRQAFELFQASRNQAFNARDQIDNTGSLEDFDAAADTLERRLQLARQGLQAAEASGNRAAIARAEQQITTALNDQLRLEERRRQIIQERRAAAEQAAAQDAAETEQVKSLVQEIQKELSILNNAGGILNDQQLENQERRVGELLEELGSFGLDSGQIDLNEFLGIQELTSRFQKDLSTARRTISERRGGIVGEVEQIFSDLNAVVDDNVIEIAVELNLVEAGPDQLADLTTALKNGTREIDTLTGAQERYDEAASRVAAQQQLLKNLFEGTTGPETFLNNLNKGIDEIANNSENLNPETIKNFLDALEQVVNTDFFGQVDLAGPEAGDTQTLQAAKTIIDQLVVSRKNLAEVESDTEGDRNRLQALLQFQKAADTNIKAVQQIINSLSGATTAAGQIGEAALGNITDIDQNRSAWDSVKTAAEAARDAVNEYSTAVQNAPPPPAGAGGVNSMFGGSRGFLFRAAGGFARGTDTIPAMLSPGEFVVNARASRQFASQLIAMNAGVTPTYRQEGGPITNNTVNVGDINVNGTANPDDTARRVVSQLRREFRRGTASRFN